MRISFSAYPHFLKAALSVFLMLLRVIVFFIFIAFLHSSYAEERVIVNGEVYYSGSSLSFPENVSWEKVELPFSRPGKEAKEYIWFRFHVDHMLGAESLYIQNQVFDFDIYLNHQRIGGTTRRDGLQAMGWNHPFFMEMLPSLWKEKNNFIHIRLRDGQPNAILSPIFFGNADELENTYKNRYFLQVTISGWSLMACLLMGALTVFIWFWRRQDMKYLYFSLVCFSWSVVMSYLFLPYAPIEHVYWLRFGYFCVDFSALLVVMFINRLVELENRLFERVMIFITLLSGLAILNMPIYQHNLVTSITHGLHCLFVFYISGHVFIKAIRHKSSAAIWTSIGLVFMGLIMIRDIYVFIDAYSKPQRLPDSTMMQYGFGLLLLVMFVYLIKKFVDALNETEKLNGNLEKRVEQATISMEEAFAENKAFEIEATAQRERQKIYRDLHDDVGAKLVSIIHSGIENSQTDLAREALVSLREAVTQNNFQYQQLLVLIRSCVTEMENRLLSANIHFMANGVDDLVDANMSPGTGYHISRIFREIVSNIIKHANSTQVLFSCENEDQKLVCYMEDDGVGLSKNFLCGNGMFNIQHRAREIGSSIDWGASSSGGCLVKFSLDLYNHNK